MQRISVDQWAMQLAYITAQRSTCQRRHVGCVLLDCSNRVLATGFNGVASGLLHCNEGHPCAGANSPSGTDLDYCSAIHAEQNALIQCRSLESVYRVYVTTMPCTSCQKLLMATSAIEVIYGSDYPHNKIWNRGWRLYVPSE